MMTYNFSNFPDTNFYLLSYNFNGKYFIPNSGSISVVIYQDQSGQTCCKYTNS